MRKFYLGSETESQMLHRIIVAEIAKEVIGIELLETHSPRVLDAPLDVLRAWRVIGQMPGWKVAEDCPRHKHERSGEVTHYYAEADDSVSDEDFYLFKLKYQRAR